MEKRKLVNDVAKLQEHVRTAETKTGLELAVSYARNIVSYRPVRSSRVLAGLSPFCPFSGITFYNCSLCSSSSLLTRSPKHHVVLRSTFLSRTHDPRVLNHCTTTIPLVLVGTHILILIVNQSQM